MKAIPYLTGCVLLGLALTGCLQSAPSPATDSGAPGTVSAPTGEALTNDPATGGCDAAMAAWLSRTDKNGDGIIIWPEFQASGQAWFATLDSDKAGYITADQLTRARLAVTPIPSERPNAGGPPGSMDGNRGRRGSGNLSRPDTVMGADANADFRVSRQEYDDYLHDTFSALDQQRNGHITMPALRILCVQTVSPRP